MSGTGGCGFQLNGRYGQAGSSGLWLLLYHLYRNNHFFHRRLIVRHVPHDAAVSGQQHQQDHGFGPPLVAHFGHIDGRAGS
ncbi:hypothetical protein AD933_02660 [Acetobacter malorum]|uniref:Uncharacterized protein n=1 Tax=Acetobacter malorum TaxID=178901 RepID=A0A149RWJ1_9PROT|nr:hypothetical protein AD933_02660 [Acetobacter malorum]